MLLLDIAELSWMDVSLYSSLVSLPQSWTPMDFKGLPCASPGGFLPGEDMASGLYLITGKI